jgi:hypothetical protein
MGAGMTASPMANPADLYVEPVAHTPGRWQVSGVRLTYAPRIGRDTRLLQVGPDGDVLALVYFDMRTARGQADARLIAAAPQLLEVAELAEAVLNTWHEGGEWPSFAEWEAKLRAAIAAARKTGGEA